MLCFLEGKTISAITLQDKHLYFHLKKNNKRNCLDLVLAETFRNYTELAMLNPSLGVLMKITALQLQC